MDQARQSKVLLGDVEMRGSCVAKTRREAASLVTISAAPATVTALSVISHGAGRGRPSRQRIAETTPERENELPSDRIEKPPAGLGPIRQIEAESARGRIETD